MARKRSKRYNTIIKDLDVQKVYSVSEALASVKKLAVAKFDETIELAINLGVDPRHANQMVRGAVVMPSGMGKKVRIVVVTSGEKIAEAEKAGADYVGGDEIINKISGGWLDFDRVIATPDMMGKVGKIGRILGSRGLMPNPKLGTVTPDVAKAIQEQKLGKVEYRTDKNGIIHVPIGKKSFSSEQLFDNFKALVSVIIRAKPASSKGTYLRAMTLSSTMSPGIQIDVLDVPSAIK